MNKTEAQAAAAAAQTELTKITADLTAARKAFLEAEERWLDQGTDRAREAKQKASDQVERQETLQKRATSKLEDARAALARIERDEMQRRHAEIVAKLDAFGAQVDKDALEFVALDRQIEERAFQLGEKVTVLVEEYKEAVELAQKLQLNPPAQPDRSEVAMRVRRAISDARKADGAQYRGEVVREYMRDSADAYDWRLRGLTQSDIETFTRSNERDRAIVRDKERAAAQAAAFRAGADAERDLAARALEEAPQ